MFEIGFTELLLIGVVALLVLGPERLPRAARMAGLWMRRARASWYSVRAEMERELADEDLRRSLKAGADELRRAQTDLADGARSIGGALPAAIGEARQALADSAASEVPAPVAPPPTSDDGGPRA